MSGPHDRWDLLTPLSDTKALKGPNTTTPCPLLSLPGVNLVVLGTSRALRAGAILHSTKPAAWHIASNPGDSSGATVPTQQSASHGPNSPLCMPTRAHTGWGWVDRGGSGFQTLPRVHRVRDPCTSGVSFRRPTMKVALSCLPSSGLPQPGVWGMD